MSISRFAALAAASLFTARLATAIPQPVAKITEFPLVPGSAPQGITLGPDGNIWFTESGRNKVGFIQPNGDITELPLPTAGGLPNQLIIGAAGDVFYTAPGASRVGTIDALANFSLQEGFSLPQVGITFGFQRRVWQTNATAQVSYHDSKLGGGGNGCTMSDGLPHEFHGIVQDREGLLRIADVAGNALVTLSPSSCIFGSYALPNPDSGPNFLVNGFDGAVWLTEYTGDRIGRSDGYGSFVEFPLPTGSAPMMIAASPDGTMWFAEQGTNQIGHITPSGGITHFTIPTAFSAPYGVAVGPDGSVWFTEENGDKLGRLQLHPSGDVNGDGSVNASDVFYLINFLFGGGPAPR